MAFCHGTARDDNEFILVDSPVEHYRAAFAGLAEPTVVVGHTHMPFDRLADGRRVINPGSVGLGYGHPGASWALLGPDVVLRRTLYDTEAAAAALEAAAPRPAGHRLPGRERAGQRQRRRGAGRVPRDGPAAGRPGALSRTGPGPRNHRRGRVVHPGMATGHTITTTQGNAHVVVTLGGTKLAESDRPVLLDETGLPTRYYLPRADVRTDLLRATDTHTTCPFKGVASYWSAEVDGEVHEDLVWSYPDPIPQAAQIAGLLCFYPDRVELSVDGEPR